MTTREAEQEALVSQGSEGEAGVADLLDLYMRLEAVYVDALEALEDGDIEECVSDSTNDEQS